MPISFKNVFYTYGEKTPFRQEALFDVNAEIKKGSFTCLVGHTGCGKSTFIQQMNGLLIPSKGDVIVDEYVVSANKKKRTKKLHDLRKKLGIVFQFSEYQLFDETVEDDVAFGPTNFGAKKEDAIKIAHECLKTVGIPEEYFKKSPFELSGGERRRVAIAGILALKPEILVLDEPTAGLDPQGSKEMLSLFKEFNKNGTTIILVTHDMNIVFEYADDVIVMNEGRIVKHCSPKELLLENVEQYSLDTPLISKFIQTLEANGMKINLDKVRSLVDLVNEIAKEKKR